MKTGLAVPTPNYSQTNMKVITSLVAPLTGTLGELEVSDGNLTTTETEAEYSYTHVPDPESEGENLLHTSYSEVGQIKNNSGSRNKIHDFRKAISY